ncbi:transposase family protein [Micromonospora antibiotica]|uniref:transposase family protein n=1 Tax=Micromonospora antibiotica TaxID=2807623 RepID=UPI0035574C87
MIVVRVMVGAAIMTNRRLTGLSRSVIEDLVSELRPRWQAQHRDRLASRIRRRRIGAGARHRFGFVDRLLATLVHLRHGLTHDVIAAWFGVHRSTISRSISQIRPLLAERGCRVRDGVRLRPLSDVVAHLGYQPHALMDATEVRVRRPVAGRAGRDRFVSGKARLNTMKALVIGDPLGRLLFCGETRPGSMHDITQARTAGPVALLLNAPWTYRSSPTPATRASAPTQAARSSPPDPSHANVKPPYHRVSSPPTRRPANGTPPSASESSRPSDTSRTGESSAATTAGGSPSTPPSARSPASCPTTNTPAAARTPPGGVGPYPPHLTFGKTRSSSRHQLCTRSLVNTSPKLTGETASRSRNTCSTALTATLCSPDSSRKRATSQVTQRDRPGLPPGGSHIPEPGLPPVQATVSMPPCPCDVSPIDHRATWLVTARVLIRSVPPGPTRGP